MTQSQTFPATAEHVREARRFVGAILNSSLLTDDTLTCLSELSAVAVLDLTRAQWCKSTFSGGAQNCVEVARNLPGVVAVRDSKDQDGPVLLFSPDQWHAFIAEVGAGESGASGRPLSSRQPGFLVAPWLRSASA